MPPLQIRDVMTREVITATPTTPVAEIAALLTTHRISAVPIVDDNDRVLGVVSEADLLPRIPAKGRLDRALRRRTAVARTRATHARDLMSSPPVTIGEHAPLAAAARQMQADNIRRLPVTDDAGRLRGIVSRTDLIRPLTRPDEAIEHDIVDELRRVLWIEPRQVEVHVEGGVATLTGALARRSTAAIAARLSDAVPGVVAVVNRIGYEFDDAALARSHVNTSHPFSADPFTP
jgi:CBS-domain-containing membrane protein